MKVVALAGGVGGAKLAEGIQLLLAGEAENLTVVVNTADDFNLWGLRICPDLDTVMYTLAGVANPETGWGVAGDSFVTLEMLANYGEDIWFKLGDKDLGTHILRTARMGAGERLTRITADLTRALEVPSTILPMCDEPVATVLDTPVGRLEFQEYFVGRGQRDEVQGVELVGIEDARLPEEVSEAVAGAETIVFCPSNPVVSIGPILAVPGMQEALLESRAPKVAVSPIVGGRALRGPAAEMLATLYGEVSATAVGRIYQGLTDGVVLDRVDEEERDSIEALGMGVLATDTVMREAADRRRLAGEVIDFCAAMGAGRRS